MLRNIELGCDPVHIMIVHKGIKPKSFVYSAVFIKFSPDSMSDLKIIVVVMTGIKPLVKLIICHGIQHFRFYIAAVISVDHLAHQPEIRFLFIGKPPHFFHKGKLQTVRTVKADSVNIKLMDPEADYIQKIFPHLWLPEIEIYQFKTVSPCLIAKSIIIRRIPPKINSLVPAAVLRLFSVFLNILKGKELSSCMVKYTVHYNSYIHFVGFFHEAFKVPVVSQTPVHHAVVFCIVSMGC